MTQPVATPDQEEAAWKAANQLQGMGGQPVEPAALPDFTPPPAYQGGAAPGALKETQLQGTADTLNSIDAQKDATLKSGQIQEGEGNDLASKLDAKAAEDAQRSHDYDAFLDKASARQEEDHNRAVAAQAEHDKQSAALGNPTDTYWADKSTGSRALAAFAAFASGLGAGMQGKGGNPYLDYLNHEIGQNYDAHKQHIRDLYDSQVAAGKISDDDLTKQKFMQEGKLHSFDLGAEKFKSMMEAIKNRALGANQRVLADQSYQGLTQQQIATRRAEAQAEAAAGAAGMAAARARQKEVREAMAKAIESHKDLAPEEARAQAANDLSALGFNRTEVAPQMEGVGADYKDGKWQVPVRQVPAGDGLIPTTDPVTGKTLKPEEREKLIALKVTMPDGSMRLANNAEDQKKVQQEITAHQTVTAFANKLRGPDGWIAKMNAGTLTAADIGEWEGARKASIESYKALSGAEGNTGVGTARMLGEDEFPNPPSLAGNLAGKVAGVATFGQLHTAPGRVGQYTGQLTNMDALAERTGTSIQRRLRPGGTAPTAKPAEAAPKTGKDFFAQFGGK